MKKKNWIFFKKPWPQRNFIFGESDFSRHSFNQFLIFRNGIILSFSLSRNERKFSFKSDSLLPSSIIFDNKFFFHSSHLLPIYRKRRKNSFLQKLKFIDFKHIKQTPLWPKNFKRKTWFSSFSRKIFVFVVLKLKFSRESLNSSRQTKIFLIFLIFLFKTKKSHVEFSSRN